MGLKYSAQLLNISPSKFKKIGRATKGKYLDYSTIVSGNEYEIETKGTVSSNYNSMKKDIIAKKSNKHLKKVHQRYGTIAMINNPDVVSASKCVIVDDPPEAVISDDNNYEVQLLNYGVFLSFILDSKYYNRFIKPVLKGITNRVRINDQKFFAKYSFQGQSYLGECFDRRLIRERFKEFLTNSDLRKVFRRITQVIGRTKFFIGIDALVVESINKRDLDFIDAYNVEPVFINDERTLKFLDKDGILIVKSEGGDDKQLENIFPEPEVFRRLGLYRNYIDGATHECGAPCRSRRIRGKPCEIQTFRENCHFHR